MRVYDATLRAPKQQLSEGSEAIVISHNGEHAHIIIEQDGPIVRVFMPEDAEFERKARSYGFEVPGVRQL